MGAARGVLRVSIMRVKRLTTWLVLGIAVALAYAARRRHGARSRRAVPAGAADTSAAECDPDLTVRFGEEDEELFEAISEWDDLEVSLGAEADPGLAHYGDDRALLGSGELYGVHVPSAVDRDLPDDDRAQAEGENWLEELEASAGEMGPEPEHELDVIDDSDPHAGHHKTMTGDTPVADHGAAGPRGL